MPVPAGEHPEPAGPPTGLRVAWREAPERSRRRDVAWRLLRELLPDAELSNPCPRCGGPHGPVSVAGVDARASVTYAAGLAIVAAVPSEEADAVGVDAEALADGRRDVEGLDGALGRRGATIRDWTRVEAALKADGRGLRVDPSLVVVATDEAGWSAAVPGARPLRGWDVAGPEGTVVSVAVVPPREGRGGVRADGAGASRRSTS
jgi:4'-phosphopantetheinyl transferase